MMRGSHLSLAALLATACGSEPARPWTRVAAELPAESLPVWFTAEIEVPVGYVGDPLWNDTWHRWRLEPYAPVVAVRRMSSWDAKNQCAEADMLFSLNRPDGPQAICARGGGYEYRVERDFYSDGQTLRCEVRWDANTIANRELAWRVCESMTVRRYAPTTTPVHEKTLELSDAKTTTTVDVRIVVPDRYELDPPFYSNEARIARTIVDPDVEVSLERRDPKHNPCNDGGFIERSVARRDGLIQVCRWPPEFIYADPKKNLNVQRFVRLGDGPHVWCKVRELSPTTVADGWKICESMQVSPRERK